MVPADWTCAENRLAPYGERGFVDCLHTWSGAMTSKHMQRTICIWPCSCLPVTGITAYFVRWFAGILVFFSLSRKFPTYDITCLLKEPRLGPAVADPNSPPRQAVDRGIRAFSNPGHPGERITPSTLPLPRTYSGPAGILPTLVFPCGGYPHGNDRVHHALSTLPTHGAPEDIVNRS